MAEYMGEPLTSGSPVAYRADDNHVSSGSPLTHHREPNYTGIGPLGEGYKHLVRQILATIELRYGRPCDRVVYEAVMVETSAFFQKAKDLIGADVDWSRAEHMNKSPEVKCPWCGTLYCDWVSKCTQCGGSVGYGKESLVVRGFVEPLVQQGGGRTMTFLPTSDTARYYCMEKDPPQFSGTGRKIPYDLPS